MHLHERLTISLSRSLWLYLHLTSILLLIIILSKTSAIQLPNPLSTDDYNNSNTPFLRIFPPKASALEKSTAILICEVVNDPGGPLKFEWFKDGQTLKKRRMPVAKHKSSSILRIDVMKAERDNGQYDCSVDLSSGITLRSQALVRAINESESRDGFPAITKQPIPQQTVGLGGQALIHCRADGQPELEYSWLHDFKPLDYDNQRITPSRDGTLKIYNITDNDKGEYLCMVTNPKGFVLSSASTLTVSLEPPSDSPPTNIYYKNTSPTDVTLTWQPPDHNTTLTGYEIYFGKSGSSNSTKLDVSPDVTRIAFNDLSENTEYTFRIRSRTKMGLSSYAPPLTVLTPKDSAPPPQNVKASGTSYSSAMVWWDETAYFDGITGYRLYYNQTTNSPSNDYDRWLTKEVSLTSSVIITNLIKDEYYEVRVCVIGNRLSGKLSSPVIFRAAPLEVPYDIKIEETTTRSVKLSWKQPLEMQVNNYKIVYDSPEKIFFDSQGSKRSISIPPMIVTTTNPNVEIVDLLPYTRYRINVTAVPPKEAFKPPATIQLTTSLAAPKKMSDPTPIGPTSNPHEYDVYIPWASEEFGPISHYYIVVLPSDAQSLEPDSYPTIDLIKPPVRSEKSPYVAAKLTKSKMLRRFTLGDNKVYEGFLNKPLDINQKYYIFVRAMVEHSETLFTSSPLSSIINPNISISPPKSEVVHGQINSGTTPFIKTVLVGCLAVVIILGFIVSLFYRKQRQVLKANHINETTIRLLPDHMIDRIYSSVPIEPQQLPLRMASRTGSGLQRPVPVSQLAEHIEVLKMNNNLKEEYESIEPGQQFTWEHSYLEYNRPKNRYGNVVAYDHSRVVLSTIDGVIGSDYINANYCDGYNRPNQYIATQGPLPNTVGDFWRMVWEQKSRTIVMMTQLEERGRMKCVQYWPSIDKSITYHGITITGVNSVELAYYIMRTFTIQHGNQLREVRQFQFTAWPDHGVPDHPTPFLMFLRRIKTMNPHDGGPIVVLCSAGVGRTGCFIVIESMIERMKQESTIDIYGHVTRLRAQRNYIVQTEDQYMFIHDAVLEAIISAHTEVTNFKLAEYLQRLFQVSASEGVTGLELEFKRLTSIRFGAQKFISANLPVNKHKNRLINILPYENNRVCLEHITGIEGSDYINASFCDSYTQRNAYIATQSPLPETVEDFWRMVIEHNSGIIVMLTKLKEMGREKCTQYWPAERYGDYGPYRVGLEREHSNQDTYILREFTITDSRNPNYNRKMKQFHYTNWPEQGVPKSGESFINFIAQVHNSKQSFGIEGPIIVLCSAGVGRTGVFIALSIILERLQNEGSLNLFETVRTLRTQRPGMVQSEDQYQFCYQTALEYIRSFDHR